MTGNLTPGMTMIAIMQIASLSGGVAGVAISVNLPPLEGVGEDRRAEPRGRLSPPNNKIHETPFFYSFNS